MYMGVSVWKDPRLRGDDRFWLSRSVQLKIYIYFYWINLGSQTIKLVRGMQMSGRYLPELEEIRTAESKVKPTLKEPKKYRVILLNDDYTPMEFVVDVLKRYFYLSEDVAVQVMLQVHMQGRGVCGLFTHEIAETKVALVNDYARASEYPLLCGMEPE